MAEVVKKKLSLINSGVVFRLPGCVHYWIKIDEPVEGNRLRAVGLNTLDMSGIVETFEGDQEAFIGPMGLPEEWLKPLGF